MAIPSSIQHDSKHDSHAWALRRLAITITTIWIPFPVPKMFYHLCGLRLVYQDFQEITAKRSYTMMIPNCIQHDSKHDSHTWAIRSRRLAITISTILIPSSVPKTFYLQYGLRLIYQNFLEITAGYMLISTILEQFFPRNDPFHENFYWPDFPFNMTHKIILEVSAGGSSLTNV